MFYKHFLTVLKLCMIVLLIEPTKATDYLKIFNLTKSGLKVPNKLTNCKAELDDKTIIDLTSLDNAKNPRYE